MKTTIKVMAGKYWKPMTLENLSEDTIKVTFPYDQNLINEIKSMESARWNPDGKYWTVKKSARNAFAFEFLAGKNPYAQWEQPLINYEPKRKCFKHQINMIRCGLTYKDVIIAAEMGCISGNSIIKVNVGGASFKISAQKLYSKWLAGWCYRNDISVRSYNGKYFRLNKLNNVLSKGIKKVIKLVTETGKEIILTPDHEIAIDNENYLSADKIKIGDEVLTNGKWVDKDGYIRIGGLKGKHPRWTTGGVYEHILVMEKQIGRYINLDEIVHHKNEIRNDNRSSNLELLKSNSEHAKLHGQCNFQNFGTGNLLANKEKIVAILDAGYDFVYDLVCEDPYRNFVANNILVHNCGKTLAAIEIMEASGIEDWVWVGPKSALRAVELEFLKWESKIWPKLFTYESLKKITQIGLLLPQGIIFDEASKLKGPTTQRTMAARVLTERMRQKYNDNCYIIELSGSPAPNSPADWWPLCEVVRPGFIKEGTYEKFKRRVGLIVQKESIAGGVYPELVTWYDDENKCKSCGKLKDDISHSDMFMGNLGWHPWQKSVNEVKLLYERLKGLVIIHLKKDVLSELPDKVYRVIRCEPSADILRAAKLILASAKNTVTAAMLLRELSDGFQYKNVETDQLEICPGCFGNKVIEHPVLKEWKCATCLLEGEGEFFFCPKCEANIPEENKIYEQQEIECTNCNGTGTVYRTERQTIQTACPKEEVIIDLLDEHEDIGRIVIYAGFTGSVDRCVDICKKQGWNVIRVDGRGWWSSWGTSSGASMLKEFQRIQCNGLEKIAFVGNPEAAGMGLTLTASPTIVYYSNSFKPEARIQSEDRIHRPGMDVNKGATILDIFNLSSDEKVYTTLKEKKRLQDISLGEFRDVF